MELPEGVSLRAWRRDDLAAMADLINARVDVEGVGEFATADVLAENYDHLRNCDPSTDIAVAVDLTGRIVGYARAAWLDMVTTGLRHHICAFEADDSVAGLAEAMVGWAIVRNREIAAANAAAGPVPEQRLVTFATAGTRRATALEAAGLRPESWSVYMSRPIRRGDRNEARPLPDGVEVRPVTDEQLRAIWEADIDAFRDDKDFTEQDETDFGRFVAEAEQGTELWQVAWHGDLVVGQVRTHVTPGESERRGVRRAWTENISTRAEWRKQGVASALITASLAQLARLGFEEACLGADVDNPLDPLGLYESLGYRRTADVGEWVAPIDISAGR
jgi:ribosomal protein S18 acetylase RimI-like enzyme